MFETHAKGKQHKLAEEQKQLSKQLARGNMHSQMVKGGRQQVKQNKDCNRSVIIFFLKQLIFHTQKLLFAKTFKKL